jgi:hypothetical protein
VFDRFFDLIARRWWTSLLFGSALLGIAALVVTASLRLALMLGCMGLMFVAFAVFLLIEMLPRSKNVRSKQAPIITRSKPESAFTANPPPYRPADDADPKTSAADSIERHDEEDGF